MKRKIKKIEKIKTNSGIKYQLLVEAIPTWLEKIFGYSQRNEFYSGYGSIWYREYYGDLEPISKTEMISKAHNKRCCSYVETWLTDQFAIHKLSLNNVR